GVLLYLLLTGRAPFVGTQDALMYKAVHEMPQPPSAVDGADRPRFYDTLIATAMAKNPAQRFQSAAEFKQAIVDAVGTPFVDSAWDRTIIVAPQPAPKPVQTLPAEPTTASSSLPTALATAGWDMAALAQAEASLARYVGPLANVLVRRAARDCSDLPTLYAKLADQVSDPVARSAFLDKAGSNTTAARTSLSAASTHASAVSAVSAATGGASATAAAPLSDALVEQATRLLAQHIGPIAKVVTRKAAARAPQRDAFFTALAESVDQPAARARLLSELSRLP
ncbi:MAG: hypothetical protein Q8L92_16940, partial [Rubrivivax sp.]|nr:hypothetical protein [Rubrivivax sp.]